MPDPLSFYVAPLDSGKEKRWGFQGHENFSSSSVIKHGCSNFVQMKTHYTFDVELELLASGPVIHTWEGIVQATPKVIRFDRARGIFF